LAAESDSKHCEGCAYRALGKIQAMTENPDEARKHLNLALAIFRELGDEGEVAYTLSDMANFEYEAGDSERAKKACTEALEMAEELGISKIVDQMTDLKNQVFVAPGTCFGAREPLAIAQKPGF
jgi:tetratricopeptide (TPR) repeat protein